jgi:hypothetical protein
MNRISPLITAAAVSVGLLVVPALAAGAAPTKGGSYSGTLYANSVQAVSKKVVIKVSATGTRARATFICGTQRPANWISFAVKKDGSFKAFSNTGSLTVWSIVGRFVSPGQVVAVLHLNATCDGKGGRFVAKLAA